MTHFDTNDDNIPFRNILLLICIECTAFTIITIIIRSKHKCSFAKFTEFLKVKKFKNVPFEQLMSIDKNDFFDFTAEVP